MINHCLSNKAFLIFSAKININIFDSYHTSLSQKKNLFSKG